MATSYDTMLFLFYNHASFVFMDNSNMTLAIHFCILLTPQTNKGFMWDVWAIVEKEASNEKFVNFVL